VVTLRMHRIEDLVRTSSTNVVNERQQRALSKRARQYHRAHIAIQR
jgi:hypothetical protein